MVVRPYLINKGSLHIAASLWIRLVSLTYFTVTRNAVVNFVLLWLMKDSFISDLNFLSHLEVKCDTVLSFSESNWQSNVQFLTTQLWCHHTVVTTVEHVLLLAPLFVVELRPEHFSVQLEGENYVESLLYLNDNENVSQHLNAVHNQHKRGNFCAPSCHPHV